MKYIIFITTLLLSFNLLGNEPQQDSNKENHKPKKEQKQEGKKQEGKKHRKHGPRKGHPNRPPQDKK